MVNMSTSNNTTPRSTTAAAAAAANTSQHHYIPTTTATIPVIRSTIDDFREIIREQSFILPNNSSSSTTTTSTTTTMSDQVPIKKYPPLPDISVPSSMNSSSNRFFRTEATLQNSQINPPKKQIFNHFAPTQRQHLPALNKRPILPTMSNVMDLDEDLPQCSTTIAHRAATYTSPGDRVVSPIKRPSAPSPPASAQIKRFGQHAFVYGDEEQDEEDEEDEENCSMYDDEDSRLFNDQFSRYHHQQQQQPMSMVYRRIDHYNTMTNRYTNHHERQNTLILDDEPTHPLDSIDLES